MGEPEGTEVASTQKTLSSSHNPGWNDPPKRAFLPPQTSSCTTPTKRLLNKRIAFPLNTASTSSNFQNQPPISLPPNLPPLVSCKEVSNNSSETTLHGKDLENFNSKSNIDKESILNETLANLQATIEKLIESKTKTQEVQKRIETMRTLWLDDKLDDCIHKKVLDISIALKEGDIEKADKIHIFLMMEQASVCSSWIPGIRYLISEMRCKFDQCDDEANIKSDTSLISPVCLE